MVLELTYVSEKASEANAPVSVIEKAEEPVKAFVKAESEKNNHSFLNSFPLTVNTITYNLLLHHIKTNN